MEERGEAASLGRRSHHPPRNLDPPSQPANTWWAKLATPPPPPFTILLKDVRLCVGGRSGESTRVSDRDLTSPLPHPCQVLRTASPLNWPPRRKPHPSSASRHLVGIGSETRSLGQPNKARCPRVGGSCTMTPPQTHRLSLVLSCRAGQLSPFPFSPRKGENYLAPIPGCGCRELRESGVWKLLHSKEILWGCKGESVPQPERPKGSP